MTAGEYAKSIEGIRLLARHDFTASISWDYLAPADFSPDSARRLFELLPADCQISWSTDDLSEEKYLHIRRDGEHLLQSREVRGASSSWKVEPWDRALSAFLSSPAIRNSQSGVTSFTITQSAPVTQAAPVPPKPSGPWGFVIPIIAVVLLLLGCAWYIMGPGGDGVVSYLKLPNGTECLVTQQWNGWQKFDAPYDVNFYFRTPGSGWGLCEIDHGANRWPTSKMTYDPRTQVVTIFHGNLRHSELNLRTRRFIYLNKFGLPDRETDAPQFPADPPFPPPASSMPKPS